MNPDNYGILEPCQRLVKAGIVLETEVWWEEIQHWKEDDVNFDNPILSQWRLGYGKNRQYKSNPQYPAPSMAEVNQDLPESDRDVHLLICRYLDCGLSDSRIIGLLRDINKMINFLIWITEQRDEKKMLL